MAARDAERARFEVDVRPAQATNLGASCSCRHDPYVRPNSGSTPSAAAISSRTCGTVSGCCSRCGCDGAEASAARSRREVGTTDAVRGRRRCAPRGDPRRRRAPSRRGPHAVRLNGRADPELVIANVRRLLDWSPLPQPPPSPFEDPRRRAGRRRSDEGDAEAIYHWPVVATELASLAVDWERRPACHAEALCRCGDPDLWHPHRGSQLGTLRTLRDVCRSCSVRAECAEQGTGQFPPIGVWQGSPTVPSCCCAAGAR